MEHGSGTADRSVDEAEVAKVMAQAAAGDVAALVALQERFRPELVRAIRRVVALRRARVDADALAGLVLDVAMELFELAPSWSPEGGAPPWVWAHHRVAAAVDRHLGQWASPLDDEGGWLDRAEPPASPGTEPPVVEVVARVARSEPTVALLDEALHLVATDRDRTLFLETAVQRSLGDRSPAATVALQHGLRPDAVRQQGRRVRRRIQQLAAEDPRFARLAELPVVA